MVLLMLPIQGISDGLLRSVPVARVNSEDIFQLLLEALFSYPLQWDAQHLHFAVNFT